MSLEMDEITSIAQIEKYRGRIVFVEMGWNSYLTRFYRINDQPPHYWDDGSFGYSADLEVNPDGVHGSHALTDRDIEKGTLKIRNATLEEVARVKISYTF